MHDVYNVIYIVLKLDLKDQLAATIAKFYVLQKIVNFHGNQIKFLTGHNI